MRPFLIAAILAALATPAFAAECTLLPDDSSTGNVANQTAYMLCEQQALSDATALRNQQLALEAELHQQQIALEAELKLQQQLQAAQAALAPPAIPAL